MSELTMAALLGAFAAHNPSSALLMADMASVTLLDGREIQFGREIGGDRMVDSALPTRAYAVMHPSAAGLTSSSLSHRGRLESLPEEYADIAEAVATVEATHMPTRHMRATVGM